MTTVHRPSREELAARRDAILSQLGLTSVELEEKAASGGLVGDEWSAWAEIEEIDYLLAGD